MQTPGYSQLILLLCCFIILQVCFQRCHWFGSNVNNLVCLQYQDKNLLKILQQNYWWILHFTMLRSRGNVKVRKFNMAVSLWYIRSLSPCYVGFKIHFTYSQSENEVNSLYRSLNQFVERQNCVHADGYHVFIAYFKSCKKYYFTISSYKVTTLVIWQHLIIFVNVLRKYLAKSDVLLYQNTTKLYMLTEEQQFCIFIQ